MFQSQGRFSGGSNYQLVAMVNAGLLVSIAGAILWGEQRRGEWLDDEETPFQSQGRFSGGSN